MRWICHRPVEISWTASVILSQYTPSQLLLRTIFVQHDRVSYRRVGESVHRFQSSSNNHGRRQPSTDHRQRSPSFNLRGRENDEPLDSDDHDESEEDESLDVPKSLVYSITPCPRELLEHILESLRCGGDTVDIVWEVQIDLSAVIEHYHELCLNGRHSLSYHDDVRISSGFPPDGLWKPKWTYPEFCWWHEPLDPGRALRYVCLQLPSAFAFTVSE